MSSHDELLSLLDSPEAAVEKLAEIAAIGGLIRDMRKEAGLPDKVALSLNDITTTLSGYGSQAMDWAKQHPTTAGSLIGGGVGALGGAAVGAGSEMMSPRKKKNILGNAVTGGLAGGVAGAGLGALGGMNAGGLKSLAQRFAPGMFGGGGGGPIPGDKVTPAGGGGGGITPEQEAAARAAFERANAEPVANALYGGVSQAAGGVYDFARNNPAYAGGIGAIGAYEGKNVLNSLDAVRRSGVDPRISSLNDFNAGLRRVTGDEKLRKNYSSMLSDDALKALQHAAQDRPKMQQNLLRAMMNPKEPIYMNVPETVDTEGWAKTLEGLRKQLDTRKLQSAVGESTGLSQEILTDLARIKQLNPNAADLIDRMTHAVQNTGKGLTGASQAIPDQAAIEDILTGLGDVPPPKQVPITAQHLGQISHEGRPIGSMVTPLTESYGPSAVRRQGWNYHGPTDRFVPNKTVGLRSLVNKLQSGRSSAPSPVAMSSPGGPTHTGSTPLPSSLPGPAGQGPSRMDRFLGGAVDKTDEALAGAHRWAAGRRFMPSHLWAGKYAPALRVGQRAGLYSLPVLIDLWMRGQQNEQARQRATEMLNQAQQQ